MIYGLGSRNPVMIQRHGIGVIDLDEGGRTDPPVHLATVEHSHGEGDQPEGRP